MSSTTSMLSRLLRRQTPLVPPNITSKVAAHTASTQASPAASPLPPAPPQSLRQPKSQIEDMISQLPLVQALRRDSNYTETRPNLSMPAAIRPTHFVAGTLTGSGKLTVAPYMFSSLSLPPSSSQDGNVGKKKSRVVSILHVGSQMCGHPGFVHGGFLSVMFDEIFARCVSASVPSGLAMTANLNVDYRKPALPDRIYAVRAETVKVEGRKAWVEGTMTLLPVGNEGKGNEPVTVAEARALFVEPKFAESVVSIYHN